MYNLVKVENDKFKVDGILLHRICGIKTRFSEWIQRQLKYADVNENDYNMIWVDRENYFFKNVELNDNINQLVKLGYRKNCIMNIDTAINICIGMLGKITYEKEEKTKIYEVIAYLMNLSNKNISINLKERQEIEFVNQLENALIPFGVKGKKQYQILNYRIDYYIPDLNVAIEYDENEHNGYTYDKHGGRQLEIENKLGCKFIRVSDNNTHSYNIGLVIKELFNL